MRALVLNAGYEPLAVVSERRALTLVLGGRARVLEAAENPIRSAHGEYPRPRVILLARYVRVPMVRRVIVSRKGVLRRDGHRCAYCGRGATTIDHVLPRSRGGGDGWENLVACCLRCNNSKGDRTPAEMGWTLRWEPLAPVVRRWNALRGAEHPEPVWEAYLPAA